MCPEAWCKSGIRTPGSLKLGPSTLLKFKRRTPEPPSKIEGGKPGLPSKFKSGIHVMAFLHCFTYYILYEKLRNLFKEIIFHGESLSHILCSELIHQFFENFKFYFWIHVTLGLLNPREGVFLRQRKRFLSKANKQGFQLKTEVQATCLTSNLPDNS